MRGDSPHPNPSPKSGRGGVILFALVGIIAIGGSVAYLLHDDSGVDPARVNGNRLALAAKAAPAMTPWRDPVGDTAVLFPGATPPDTGSPQIVALSLHRDEVIRRLGPETPLESNALYVFRVSGRGAIMTRRTAGEYGGIEVVVGVDNTGKAVGVRIQRHREPPEIAAAITAPAFLAAFRGKTASDDFTVGKGLPAVPPVAQKSATAVARAVRALLIEYDAGSRS